MGLFVNKSGIYFSALNCHNNEVRTVGKFRKPPEFPRTCLWGYNMQQQLLRQISVEGDTLSYYLLETAVIEKSGEARTGYGLRILGAGDDVCATDTIGCREDALRLLQYFADHEVYPIHLLDVLSDLITESIA